MESSQADHARERIVIVDFKASASPGTDLHVEGESHVNRLARIYMAEHMAMTDVYEDQAQNWILSHMATFAHQLLSGSRPLPAPPKAKP